MLDTITRREFLRRAGRSIVVIIAAPSLLVGSSARGLEDKADYDCEVAGIRELTKGPEYNCTQPCWSPDGKSIAFVKGSDLIQRTSKNGVQIIDRRVYIMNEDGTNERKLTDRDVEEECPAWSPDGNMIAFSSRCYDMTENWAIYYFDLKSKTIKKVYIGTGYSRFEMSPSWAPDSTRGIYEGLCIFDLKGKHPKYLQSDKIAHICGEDPAWSPDGKSIAFSLDHSIYRVDLKDEGDDEFIYCSEPKAIIARGKTLHSYSQPAWSPDGKKIAYACNVYFDPYPDSPFRGKYHIGVMDSDGRNMKELTTSDDILDCDPVWSPNGKHIAFSTGSPFKRNIHVIDLKLVPRK